MPWRMRTRIHCSASGRHKLLLHCWCTTALPFSFVAAMRRLAAENFFLESRKSIVSLARTDAMENNIPAGTAMNRVSISQDETRPREISQRCMKHRILYVIGKMTSARERDREKLAKFIAGVGNGPRREEKISLPIRGIREARKFNGDGTELRA